MRKGRWVHEVVQWPARAAGLGHQLPAGWHIGEHPDGETRPGMVWAWEAVGGDGGVDFGGKSASSADELVTEPLEADVVPESDEGCGDCVGCETCEDTDEPDQGEE